MAAKRPTCEVLPTLDELVADRDRDKSILDKMKKTFEVLKEARMDDLSTRCLSRLPEAAKISWLLATRGISKVVRVCSVMPLYLLI